MVAPIGIRAPGGDDSLRVALEAVEQWRAIVAALSPIIGLQGVGALYRRTLFLAQEEFGWIDVPPEAAPMDFEGLRNALSRQDPADAARALNRMSGLFRGLLAGLIGSSLVERLLPAGLNPSPGAAAQDPSHE